MINDRILEQVSYFNYLGNGIGYDRKYDIYVKVGRFQTICGTINSIFNNKVRQDTNLKFYKAIAVPVLSYGCEL